MSEKPPMDKASFIAVSVVVIGFSVAFMIAGFLDGNPAMGFALPIPLLFALRSAWLEYVAERDRDAPAR